MIGTSKSFGATGLACLIILAACSSGGNLTGSGNRGGSKNEDEKPEKSTLVTGAYLTCMRDVPDDIASGASEVAVGCSFKDPSDNLVNVAGARYEAEIQRDSRKVDVRTRVNSEPGPGEHHFVFGVDRSTIDSLEAYARIVDESSNRQLIDGRVRLASAGSFGARAESLLKDPPLAKVDRLQLVGGFESNGTQVLADGGLATMLNGAICRSGRIQVPNADTEKLFTEPEFRTRFNTNAFSESTASEISWANLCFIPVNQGATVANSQLLSRTTQDCVIMRTRELKGGKPDLTTSKFYVIENYSTRKDLHSDISAYVRQRACSKFGDGDPGLKPGKITLPGFSLGSDSAPSP